MKKVVGTGHRRANLEPSRRFACHGRDLAEHGVFRLDGLSCPVEVDLACIGRFDGRAASVEKRYSQALFKLLEALHPCLRSRIFPADTEASASCAT